MTVEGSQTLVGSSANIASNAKIVNDLGEDVTIGYEISYQTGTLTVERKKVTVTAEDKSKIEDFDDPELTAVVTGVIEVEDPDMIEYTIEREPGEAPGTYPIHVTGDTEQGNYEVEFIDGTLTIEKNVFPIDIPVEVAWDDGQDLEGIRPETVTVRLYGNGEEFGVVVLGPDGYNDRQKGIDEMWSYTFERMPRVDSNLKDIVYTVREDRTDVLTGEDGPNTYGIEETETSRWHFQVLNTHTIPGVDFSVRKIWVGYGRNQWPAVDVQVLANDEPYEVLTLSNSNKFVENLTGLPKYDLDTRQLITYSVQEMEFHADYEGMVTGDQEKGFIISNIMRPFIPEIFDYDLDELPATGITAPKSELKPASVGYEPTSLRLQLPTLSIEAGIVNVPYENGTFPIDGLGMDAGLLQGSAKPGEGISIIAAHNTVNAEDIGPFVLITNLKEGDRLFVTDENGEILIYEVYSNQKIAGNDMAALQESAAAYFDTVTLLTCEDERPEGGYAARRVVSARRVN